MNKLNKIKSVKNDKVFRPHDVIVYVALVVIIASLFLAFLPTEQGQSVEIKFGKTVLKSGIDLNTDAAYTVVLNRYQNFVAFEEKDAREDVAAWNAAHPTDKHMLLLIVIKDGYVWVEEADCHNHNCVMMGKQNMAPASIRCSPFDVTINILSSKPIDVQPFEPIPPIEF